MNLHQLACWVVNSDPCCQKRCYGNDVMTVTAASLQYSSKFLSCYKETQLFPLRFIKLTYTVCVNVSVKRLDMFSTTQFDCRQVGIIFFFFTQEFSKPGSTSPPIIWVSSRIVRYLPYVEIWNKCCFNFTPLFFRGVLLNEVSFYLGKAIPLQAWTGHEGSIWGYQISRQSAHEGGKVVSLTNRPPLPSRKYSEYSFLIEAESASGP